jgi:hypothetical protein
MGRSRTPLPKRPCASSSLFLSPLRQATRWVVVLLPPLPCRVAAEHARPGCARRPRRRSTRARWVRRAPDRRAPSAQSRERVPYGTRTPTNRRRPLPPKRGVAFGDDSIGVRQGGERSVRPRPFWSRPAALSGRSRKPEPGTGQHNRTPARCSLGMFASRRSPQCTEWLCLKLLREKGRGRTLVRRLVGNNLARRCAPFRRFRRAVTPTYLVCRGICSPGQAR